MPGLQNINGQVGLLVKKFGISLLGCIVYLSPGIDEQATGRIRKISFDENNRYILEIDNLRYGYTQYRELREDHFIMVVMGSGITPLHQPVGAGNER
jgi:hypothetical protein